jgi:RNA polymerase sigma-70 factor, ECF subfamily
VNPPSVQGGVPTAGEASEAADIALAASGDSRAYERIYRRHVARIHSLVRRMVGGEADADEVTQDVFVRAWDRLGTYRGEAAFSTWLHRLAVNVVLNWRKSAARTRHRFDDGASVDVVPTRRDAAAERMDLEDAIAMLPPGARQVFVLHDVEGYQHAEIAGLLSVTEGTTKAQLHRARMLLRGYLER